jgi:hypothetical protein
MRCIVVTRCTVVMRFSDVANMHDANDDEDLGLGLALPQRVPWLGE